MPKPWIEAAHDRTPTPLLYTTNSARRLLQHCPQTKSPAEHEENQAFENDQPVFLLSEGLLWSCGGHRRDRLCLNVRNLNHAGNILARCACHGGSAYRTINSASSKQLWRKKLTTASRLRKKKACLLLPQQEYTLALLSDRQLVV